MSDVDPNTPVPPVLPVNASVPPPNQGFPPPSPLAPPGPAQSGTWPSNPYVAAAPGQPVPGQPPAQPTQPTTQKAWPTLVLGGIAAVSLVVACLTAAGVIGFQSDQPGAAPVVTVTATTTAPPAAEPTAPAAEPSAPIDPPTDTPPTPPAAAGLLSIPDRAFDSPAAAAEYVAAELAKGDLAAAAAACGAPTVAAKTSATGYLDHEGFWTRSTLDGTQPFFPNDSDYFRQANIVAQYDRCLATLAKLPLKINAPTGFDPDESAQIGRNGAYSVEDFLSWFGTEALTDFKVNRMVLFTTEPDTYLADQIARQSDLYGLTASTYADGLIQFACADRLIAGGISLGKYDDGWRILEFDSLAWQFQPSIRRSMSVMTDAEFNAALIDLTKAGRFTPIKDENSQIGPDGT